MTDLTPRDIATDLIRAAARDIDALTISECLDETSDPDEADSIAEEVAELIRAADITVDWPDTATAATGATATTTLDLDAIRRREQAATKGPWTLRNGWGPAGDGLMRFVRIANSTHDTVIDVPDDTGEIAATQADAEFIAAARTDVTALLAEVDRLREQLFAQKPVMDAAEAWAELYEDPTSGHSGVAERKLHDAIESHRLMDLALTSARAESEATA